MFCLRFCTFFLVLILPIAQPAFASDIDVAIKTLREQRAVAEDLVSIAKSNFAISSDEYKRSKQLYENAKSKHDFYIEEVVFALQYHQLKSIRKASQEAEIAAEKLESYIRSKVNTLGAGEFIGKFGELIVSAAQLISTEVRAWFEYSDKKKEKKAAQLKRIMTWKNWDRIS